MSGTFRLGVFVAAMLLIFAGAIFWIGSKQFLFSSTYLLNAEFQNVMGLGDGATVRVGGIDEGIVKRIDLPARPDGKVRVVMDLKGATRQVVKKDSVAAIKSEGLIGDKYVEISFGSNQAQEVGSGDTIQSEAPLDIADVVKKTSVVLESANGVVQTLGATANNLQSVTSRINSGSGTVGALINNKSLYNEANAGLTAFHENMEALKHNFLLRGFFRNRGYEDSTGLTRDAIQKLPSTPSSKRFEFDASRMFDKPDSAKLKKGKVVNEAGKFLEDNPYGVAVVAARTDMKGDAGKERLLSQARAMVVRDYLVQNFRLDDTRIKTIGLGKSPEVRDGGTIEILVYPPGKPALAKNRGGKER